MEIYEKKNNLNADGLILQYFLCISNIIGSLCGNTAFIYLFLEIDFDLVKN